MSHKLFRLVSSLFLALAVTAIASGSQPARAAGPWYVTPTGDDNNGCLSPGTACATINGAINKATAGDIIKVAVGTYTDSGTEVVLIDKDITLSGGWDANFTTQNGMSTIDGQGVRQGVLVNNGTTVVIEYFTVQNGFSNLYGGGIYTEGELTLNNSTITGNTAPQYGGGISSWGSGALTINNSTISGNTAGVGGGISAVYGTLITLNSSSVINNHSIANGAGIWTGQDLILNNSTIKDNISSENGGGIFIYVTTILTLNNTTITGNQALNGGGIFLSDYSSGGGPQETIILNSTVSYNIAQSGGGIFMAYSSPSRIATIRNSIIAKNTASSAADCSGSISTSDHNILGNSTGCSVTAGTGDQFNVDPLLGPLQDNGGPTFTHALLSGSPAIDAGNPAVPGSGGNACLATDQRGVTRPQGTRCDIGAFELEADGGGGQEVTIDIKPGSQSNPINPKSSGKIPLAILSTPDFDAPSEVDKRSLTFGRTGDELSLAFCNKGGEDVNGDGLLDLVCHFKTKLTGFKIGDTEGILKGQTVNGVTFTGTDSVKVVPDK